MRTLPFYQVDVFTDRPFAGNPLAVFPDAEGLTAVQMQAIASEMNLSETTFVLPPEGDGDARVRIFTPALELPFAGHPSVGTACELVRLRLVDVYEPITRVVLELDVGPTAVDVSVRGGVPVSGTVHQRPPVFHAPAPRGSVAAVLGLDLDDLHPEFDPVPVDTGLCYTIIPLASQRALARVSLDLQLAADFERRHAEIYPCAFTGQDDPWMEARGLFPFAGITEDPATAAPPGRWPPTWRARACCRRTRSASCCRAGRSGVRASSRSRSPGRASASRTSASAGACSRCCEASSSWRIDRRRHINVGCAGGALDTDCGRAGERAPARRAPRRTDYRTEELVSGRRPEGPRGARTTARKSW